MSGTYVPARVEAYNDKSTTNIIEQSNRPQTVAAVGAQWLHNLGGGLGAAVVWVAGSFAVHGAAYWMGDSLGVDIDPWPNPVRVGIAAFVVGCGVFGLLMALRASLDEIVQAGEWNQLQAEYDALEQEHNDSMAAWSNKYQLLQRDLATLQADYKLLLARKGPLPGSEVKNYVAIDAAPVQARGTLPQVEQPGYVARTKATARGDATTLLERAYHKHKWSRDAMMTDHKWNKERWYAARDWLVAAKVLYYDGENGTVPKWVYADDMNQALLAMDRYEVERHGAMA
jgi:hypothetical protein